MPCAVLTPDEPFLSGMLGYVDCQAQAIGQGGYQALATTGSNVSVMLTGLLTIFVALIGYRMLLGEALGVRDGVLAAAKLGMVLVLATSWPAFRVLVYDVAMHGPAELAASIGQAADLPGAGGGLVGGLQGVDDEFAELTTLGTGKPPGADMIGGFAPVFMPSSAQGPQQQQEAQRLALRPRWDPARDAAIVANGHVLYRTGAIAAFASVRLVAGLLLALGPFFALFLLFPETRGLFEGWIRALAGAALGGVATAILLGVQVALMAPWLDLILVQRRDGISMPDVPAELLVVGLVFAVALLAALVAMARIAWAFRLPRARRLVPARGEATASAVRVATSSAAREARPNAVGQRSRALAVADGVAALQRREAPVVAFTAYGGGGASVGAASLPTTSAAIPSEQPGRRRTRGRVSASARRRDAGA